MLQGKRVICIWICLQAKEELEQRQNELQEMMERLEASKELELAERQKMEDEIR